MRIIGGRHRGAKLADLAGSKTRPTADRVRESIFNIITSRRYGSPLISGIVLDLFAGTGAIGLEALSRGAAKAHFVENNSVALAVLRENVDKLQRMDDCRVIAGDAIRLVNWRGDPANLVFADAPYGTGDGLRAIANLQRIGALCSESLVVIETDRQEELDPDILAKTTLKSVECRHYGKAAVHFLMAG
jgi:16S rRNA (guanine966-N2)-methyltransferase